MPSLIQSPSRALPQIDQYQLVRSIGAGGMGVVYEAVHLRLRRRVALKILSPHALASTDAIDRFEREVAAIGQLSHPNIVQALDAGLDGTTHFLVMEYVDGSNVESICRQSGPLRIEDACEVVRQAALGLIHVHTFGIVHRDLKPSNLLLSKSGQVKIADLGLARFFVPVDDESLTNVGDILGTYDYMSPEQAAGGKVGPEADVYSLGATLYRLLAGTPVFPNSRYPSPSEKLRAHMQELPPKVSSARDGIPAQLDDLLLQLLNKDPSARPASLDKVVDVLGQFTKQADLSALIAADSTPARAFDLSTQVMASGPTKPKRPLRLTTWSRGRASLTAGIAVTIIAFAAWWFAGRNGVGVSSTPLPIVSPPGAGALSVPEDVISNTMELRQWHPLLNREPTPVVWPHDAISSYHFDAARHVLNVSCAVVGVVGIGSIEPSSYRVRLEVHQNQWHGNAGIALGLRPNPDSAGGCIAHGLIFEAPLIPGVRQQMRMSRAQLVFTPLPDGDFRMQTVNEHAFPIELPNSPTQSLEVEVLRGALVRIRWGETEVTSLCTDDVNQSYSTDDYVGGIGIVVSESDVSVSGVQVMPLYK